MLHLAVPLLLAAAPVPVVTAPAPARVEITLLPETELCTGVLEPDPWRDPSSAWFFVTGPTARLDQYELSAGTIAALIDVRFARGAVHLFVLGSPIRSGLQFTNAGWRPRWPFC